MTDILILLQDPSAWVALATLVVMEIVLGIDNLVFVAILTNSLPEHYQVTARRVGIGLALVLRLVLLGTIAIIVHLTEPVLRAYGVALSWRDLILIAGGLFLVYKATSEIHENMEPDDQEGPAGRSPRQIGFANAIVQIIVLDLVFSLDSIITAVGMTDHIPIMFAAVIIAVSLMMLAATPLAEFIKRNPTIVMLALGFLLMIGMTLIADGLGVHVPKGYIYTAMAFSAGVETLNTLARRGRRKRSAASIAERRLSDSDETGRPVLLKETRI
ncbi:TerC family protein [Lichenihabitans sp. Uapishka_5]|uniref:TerC family protein n=1 Tax=Lichenihabitans sp. Uapishka_5 TaxID=3037302 RepID=UPI0029E7E61D|nr:TerC family protein [Lichenihabitans sp. Uapishka_5]MDX7950947.1 TerC family protein [Lichenihabitans sp. Uapishka_5]